MSEDKELERLKRKKLIELQKRFLKDKAAEAQKEKLEESKKRDPKEVLKGIFHDNAWVVWQAAEKQHPQAAIEVAKSLGTLVESGKLREKVTGEQLYSLFMRLGLRIRMETKIRIFEGGELKTVAEKLREK